MNRMPPPEGPGPAAPPGAHGVYDHAWRPAAYPPSFDNHAPDSHHPSATSQAHIPPGYSVMPNRELPQLPADGPYGRPNSLPGPAHPVQESPPPHASYRHSNGLPPEVSPHSAPPDYRPRMGYEAPPQPAPSEAPPNSGPPPSSQFMTPAQPMPSASGPPYDPSYYQNPAFGARRGKAARAVQACDQCRARKAKCDEGRPACSACKEGNLACVYKEVPPHKQEKSAQVILDRILEMEDKMTERINTVWKIQETHGHQLETQGQALKTQGQQIERLLSTLLSEQARGRARMGGPVPPVPRDPLMKGEAPVVSTEAPEEMTPFYGQQSLLASSASFDDSLRSDNEGELSIPVEHTTAAHKLLMWPSIKRLLHPHDYDEDYVMRLEEERGLISVYGQGEISYTADDTQLPSPPSTRDGVGVSVSFDETRFEGESRVQTSPSSQDSDAEIDRFGLLNLDGRTARRYYQSYLERMHKLHPFLDQTELDGKVEMFIRYFCPITTSPVEQHSTLYRDNPPGAKRKRSVEEVQGIRGRSADAASGTSRPRVGRNIDNAIILLVLALGSICETKSPLPGPIMDHKIDYRQQHIPGPLPPLQSRTLNGPYAPNGVLSPANSDSALANSQSFYGPQVLGMGQYGYPTSTPETRIQKSLSKRSFTSTRDEYGHVKNLQVIPGLALYGFATGILGHLQGGVDLEHVQAGLLAGLYAGQLAHPFQSHGWICQAARACQVLVRQRRYERLEDGPTQDLYNFAYWTCLQLESDLLAELDIPASGISRSEGRMGLPKGMYTIVLPDDLSAPSTMMMLCYSAQIHLRKVLNRVHTDLYKVEKQGQTRWSSNVQETLSMNLDLWRSSLPHIMKWKDTDPPATDINAARMRAKYYGARYIIHRPLLYHALHYGQNGARVGSVGQASVDSPTGSASNSQTHQMSPSMTHTGHRATGMSRMMSDMGTTPGNASSFPNGWTPPTVNLRDLPYKLRRACKVCVDSAVLSTEAFDGIEDRLVVTNIFGTAHAQFGNMLVLSATYMSSLGELVNRSDLERLLKRTIRFLLRSVNISPTLRADARILTEIYEKIFGAPPVLN